ncbi:hypothetical protein CDAR_622341 [Caerostris darwini]|uniref:Uncharacterized protein n=1 Tax=Caerostris darwini TaxID=1538125 RepID=A0AAV4W3D4_9ARAC|nr:hypothetical protein CDAR_622341 [Caerostris darwini]
MLRYKVDSKVLRAFAFHVSEEIFRFGKVIIRTACHSEKGEWDSEFHPYPCPDSIFVFTVRNFLIFLFTVQKNMRYSLDKERERVGTAEGCIFFCGGGRDGRGFGEELGKNGQNA